ncbi:2Fe-2S iron-sulfur cluster-binding protein [Streptomyces californicus]|uniref:2Fe-2S iron-sulfur cluster-binding protein n=1 Tax=Streptomyces californicus TaxID=67351 RepID=UPI0036913253
MSNEEDPRRSDRHDQYGWQGHSEGPDSAYGGWEPTPQGDGFDADATAADATAFVHIPPEDLADIPLAAPGHGYVPPMIVPLTPAAGLDPAATGSWVTRTRSQQAEAEQRAQEAAGQETADGQETGAVHWPDPNQRGGVPSDYRGPYEDTSHATAQWNFTDALGAPQAAPETGRHGAQDASAASGHGGHGDHTGHEGHGGHTGHVDYAGLTDAFGHTGAHGHAGASGQRDDFGHGDDFGHAGYAEGAGHLGHTGPADHMGHPDHAGHPQHTGDFGPADPAGHADSAGRTVAWPSPATDGDLPEASGEPPVPAPAQQWYTDSSRPATLPGGAPAPWATQIPEPEPVPTSEPEPEADPLPIPEARQTPEAEPAAPEPAEDAAGQSDHANDAHPVAPADAEDAPAAEASGPDVPDLTAEASPAEPGTPDGAVADAEPDARAVPAEAPAPPHPEHGPGPETEQRHAPEPAPDLEPASEAERHPGPEAEAEPEVVLTPAPAPLDAPSDHPATSYVLHVNGMDRPVSDAWIGESLLYVLRERLGLAGAKDGCSQGECGACNVQVDGRLVASCLVPAATTAGSEVRTVEGLAVDGEPSDVQRALAACGAVQCGFCIPGMAMTVHDLLEGNHAPTELETRQALCGNLCRCSGYRGVLDAVADVVASREASAEAAAAPDAARIPHQAEPGAGGVQQGPHPHEGEAL